MSERYIRFSIQKNLKHNDKLYEMYTLHEDLFCQEFVKYAKLQFVDPHKCVRTALEFPVDTIVHNGYVMNICIHFAWLHGDRETLKKLLTNRHQAGSEFLEVLSNPPSCRMVRNGDASIKGLSEKLVLAIARSEEEALELAHVQSDILIKRFQSIISELNCVHSFITYLNSIDSAVISSSSFSYVLFCRIYSVQCTLYTARSVINSSVGSGAIHKQTLQKSLKKQNK